MSRQSVNLTIDQEMAVLQFWARGKDIKLQFSAEEIASVRGLSAALEAVLVLPASIGWDDVAADEMVSHTTD
jgi:hypothetical protein